MGETERYIDYGRRKFTMGSDGNGLMMLVAINAIFFIGVWFIKIVYYILQSPAGAFENNLLPWFTLPANLSTIANKPWTVLTHFFTHTGVILTITNMLWLWAFGSILQNVAGNRKVIPLYIYGGITGAVAFVAAMYLIPPLKSTINTATLQGASAAIMGIAVATTTLAPDYRFFKMLNGGIPIWVLTLLFVIIDFAGISSVSTAYNISHLAGGLVGFMFAVSLRKGRDWSKWMNNFYDWLINIFNPDRQKARSTIKEKVFYRSGKQKPFVKRSNITQQRIDDILDKINQKGYHLLTEEEKNILKRAREAEF